MSDEARLFLLKEKLTEIKTKRIVSWIGSILIGGIIMALIDYPSRGSIVGWVVGFSVGFFLMVTLERYYKEQKAKIMQQIEQMAFKTES